ncbi:unnamed protein product [Musa acuminata subsp. malaccensis]|uniref:(wild Malaysian banana) hypothetical protein n=1 Tax=Musa acuminata subsp. malaccensis TaxID=214687 RepID=A0A804JKU0_MUSAM|nr:PREDICTED: uncharacterized protein LOC103989030 [Musa acuminata subsp. malaccensis]CAG1847502.1 unnamed protein product [Musa acuminata subsp. malaccensis]
MAAITSDQRPSILSRVERLDLMLGYLEELRSSRGGAERSPGTSTTSGGGAVTTSDGGNSSVDSSPKSLDHRMCRPIGDVVVETQVKGNLIDRVEHLEIRLLKIELEKKKSEEEKWTRRNGERRTRGRGLRRLITSCVKGDLETKE